ncbi:MAG: DUF1559 domain-containing protein [Planctomycetia bacterium]|nr:DUF1559 domain-containing protein [Planctomycetia bacterium]
MELFSVSCETCSARLKVRSASAIGQIVECPKCGSFVKIAAPPGWKPPEAKKSPDPLSTKPAAPAKPPATSPAADDPSDKPAPAPKAATAGASAKGGPAAPPARRKPSRPSDSQVIGPSELAFALSGDSSGGDSSGELDNDIDTVEESPLDAAPGRPADAARRKARPAPPKTGLAAMAEAGLSLGAETGGETTQPPADAPASGADGEAPDDEEVETDDDETVEEPLESPPPRRLRRWMAAAVLVATLVGLGVWGLSGPPRRPSASGPGGPPPSAPTLSGGGTVAPGGGPAATQSPQVQRLGDRWLPRETRWLLTLKLADLLRQPSFQAAARRLDPLWRQAIGPLTEGLSLSPSAIRRMTWAVVDADDWRQGVVVLELEQALSDADKHKLTADARPLDFQLGPSNCHQKTAGPWQHPFAFLEPGMIVTGPEALLRKVAAGDSPGLAGTPVGELLATVGVSRHAALVVDAAELRRDGVELPRDWLAHPAVAEGWGSVRAFAGAIQFELHVSSRLEFQVHVLCQPPKETDKILQAAKAASGSLPAVLAARADGLQAKLRDGALDPATAVCLDHLLRRSGASLSGGTAAGEGAIVRFRAVSDADLALVAVAAVHVVPGLETMRIAAVQPLDEANHRELARGLLAYAKANGSLPAGAAGPQVAAPERRLSWIASLLPYCERDDWAKRLNPQRPWNDPVNDPIAREFFPRVVNPAFGRERTAAGYPVTHYVGVAGVGADAAELPADHDRAGLFGYNRGLRLEELTNGQSSTLAVLGVSANAGAWASGGPATVRALTKPPYVNGPDGFGSGQRDGMLGAMADGSVRMISRKIDPQVLERLAVVRGPRPSLPDLASHPPPPVPPMPMPMPMQIKRPAAAGPKVDIVARLADKVVEQLDAPSVPLGDLVEFVEQMSTIPITLDLDAMADLGVSPDTRVSVRLKSPTVAELLTAALADVGLAYEIEGGHLVVTSTSRLAVKEARYDVEDLAAAPAELAALVRRVVAPLTWKPPEGTGRIDVAGPALVVTNSSQVHAEVVELLERLRVARGLRPRLRDPADVPRATRWSAASPILTKTLSANFSQPASLRAIADFVQQQTGAKIYLDSRALREAELSAESETTLSVKDEPLFAVFDRLAQSLSVAIRIVDAKTFQVTTVEAMGTTYELELYPVAELLKAGPMGGETTGDGLAERVRSQVAETTWDAAGGQGAIVFDAPSKRLIVWQTQLVQRQIEQQLAQWREADEPPQAEDAKERPPAPPPSAP